MALRGTLTHRKTRRLAQMLGIPPTYALGILEALWAVTAEHRPRGDIGFLANADIAMEMFYDGDADALIQALVTANLIDENPEHRLLVHDWCTHSDDTTDAKVGRTESCTYACGTFARGKKLTKDERSRLEERRSRIGGDQRQPTAANGSLQQPTAANGDQRRLQEADGDQKYPAATNGDLPEPVPVPVPEPKVKTLPAGKRQAAAEGDTRHAICREHVHSYWRHRHPEDSQAPWNGSDAAKLKLLLEANPELTPERFRQLLYLRELSEVNQSERPRAWLERLTDFAGGPLDRFGRELSSPASRVYEPGIYKPPTNQERDEQHRKTMKYARECLDRGEEIPAHISLALEEWENLNPHCTEDTWTDESEENPSGLARPPALAAGQPEAVR